MVLPVAGSPGVVLMSSPETEAFLGCVVGSVGGSVSSVACFVGLNVSLLSVPVHCRCSTCFVTLLISAQALETETEIQVRLSGIVKTDTCTLLRMNLTTK